MSGHSSLDPLRRLAAVSDVDAAAAFRAAGREELLDGVMRAPVGRGRPAKPATRRPLVVALAVIAAAALAGGAWALFGSSAHETTSIECSVDGTDTIIPAVSGDPAYDCARILKDDTGTDPPPLAAYDNGTGGVTVLPRSTTPPSGFKRLQAGQDVALIQLQDSLDDYIGGLTSSCLTTKAATALTEAKLRQFGFAGWTVALRNASGSRLCTSSEIIEPGTQTVTLIPVETPTTPETTYQKLADRLRPVAQKCESLPNAVSSVRAAASDLGLSEATRTYRLNTVTDNSLRCASIYETVGGTIFVTVRGPSG
jgi:hypothetical protein